MAQISSGVGLVSGINYQSLISQLIAIDEQPQEIVQSQINEAQAQQQAYQDLTNDLTGLQNIGNNLALPQTFAAATTTSSDPNTLTATAAEGAAVGTYQFQVAQLVSTQQLVTNGFANTNSAPVGAGTLTIEEGGGQASSQTPLSQLNGGQGVDRGEFRITDRSGASAVVNISDAVTLDDVVSDINSAPNISVKATLTNNGIQLTDTSGQTTDNLTVTDLSGGTAAADLGIAGTAGPTSNTLTGTAINYIGAGTALGTLNDGRGVRANSTGADFQVNLSDGTDFQVTLGTAQSVGDVLNAINTAGDGKVKAEVAPDGQSIELQDLSGGTTSTFSVTALNGSDAASDLGILGSSSTSTLNGSDVLANVDSVLVSSLNGGNGIPLGQISITNRTGDTPVVVDLSSAKSFSDILNDINNAGAGVTASLNPSGTGIQLTDTTGGTGNLVISDVNSTTASALGIAGTFTTATPTVVGANLQRQYISQNTLLSSLNGGQGIDFGQFEITNSAGATSTIDLTSGSYNTVGDVINAINNAHTGVTASINSTGNGLLLTDNAGGKGKLTVNDVDGTSAANLNIAGTATGTTINGAYEKTIAVTSTDTLSSVQNKINSLGFGVTAQIVNDGSATNPYRLTLTSVNSGQAGQVIVDGGTTNLAPKTLVQGQDAAVFYGGGGSTQPLLITSSSNQINNVVKGVTLNLTGASSTPVTLTVSSDPSDVETDLTNFVSQFNTLIDSIGILTNYNTTTNQGSLLLGDETTQQIQQVLYSVINGVVKGAGQYSTLADVGISIDTTNGATAQLVFDTNTFSSAFAANPTAVTNLFSQATTGFGNQIASAVTQLTDPINGLITLQENTLTTEVQNYQNYYAELNTLVQQKQQQLETQFANLEGNLASLQSQGQVLDTLSGSTENAVSSASSTPAAQGSSQADNSSSSSSSSG
ncbi:MAG: flagellar filament capping protein FliD [Tepidisphaeraceae bacterium]|jgi:flagellar hook-associated protein 2